MKKQSKHKKKNNKNVQKVENKIKEVKSVEKKQLEKEEIKITENEKKPNYYIGFGKRVAFWGVLFLIFSLLSSLLIKNILNSDNKEILNYKEIGSIDYKVHLNPNEFYQEEYLDKDMVYIASLIKNIELDIDYEYLMSKAANTNLSYEVTGLLKVYDEPGTSVLFEKEYVLLYNTEMPEKNVVGKKINEKLLIDYGYYNSLANSFKATYGVDSNSDLTVYIKIKNDIKDFKVLENSEMKLTIPLTQKTIDIKFDDKGINKTKKIQLENDLKLSNIISAIVLVIFSFASVFSFIKLIKLLLLLKSTKSKYDKYVEKLLNEYDRLIVETPTLIDFSDKNIIKISKFEELLDVRDNLKKPIIYHSLVKHHKSYFYVENYPNCYLYVLKASDINETNKK